MLVGGLGAWFYNNDCIETLFGVYAQVSFKRIAKWIRSSILSTPVLELKKNLKNTSQTIIDEKPKKPENPGYNNYGIFLPFYGEIIFK